MIFRRGICVLAAAGAVAACVDFPENAAVPDAGVYDGPDLAGLLAPIHDGWALDGASATYDTWPSWPDTYRPPDQQPPATTNNSGQLCTTTCPSSGEECLSFGTSSGGMCLGKCSNPGSSCPVANSATQMSFCAIGDPNGSQFFCVYFCEIQGQTFSCPDPANNTCMVADPSQPTTKVCMPK
jgi:hypothetical protein